MEHTRSAILKFMPAPGDPVSASPLSHMHMQILPRCPPVHRSNLGTQIH